MCVITKCTLVDIMIQPLNKTARRSAQRVSQQNLLKIEFPLCFGFVKPTKNKLYILTRVFKLLVEISLGW